MRSKRALQEWQDGGEVEILFAQCAFGELILGNLVKVLLQRGKNSRQASNLGCLLVKIGCQGTRLGNNGLGLLHAVRKFERAADERCDEGIP